PDNSEVSRNKESLVASSVEGNNTNFYMQSTSETRIEIETLPSIKETETNVVKT
ncbi:12685_t:CDS:1, partial [Gigaspora rosea]